MSETAATAQEALARARRHARAAAAEALAALRALLDAATLSTSGEGAANHRLLAPAAALLEDLMRGLDPRGAGADAQLLGAVADALDEEVARWEARARDDADARAVLRTLLGLREILWELGVRPKTPPPGPRSPRPGAPQARPAPRRVQRVQVDG